jgi:hypothetical protein
LGKGFVNWLIIDSFFIDPTTSPQVRGAVCHENQQTVVITPSHAREGWGGGF